MKGVEKVSSIKALIANLQQLGIPRLAALGGVGVVVLILLGVLVIHGMNAANSLLYKDLDPHEAGEIVDQLSKAHITYRLQDDGATIVVPDGDVARARLFLAKNGLPSAGSVGYEIFDKGNGFTSTEFEQNINETRALEGELERSIRLINGVKNARVHLVLRHRELFSTEQQSAQASVLLSMDGGRRLGDESVSAIVNLVSTAVPGLDPRNISLIDNRGHVLLRQGVGTVDGSRSLEEQRQALEERLSRAVEDMLGSTLGPEHVRVEANVEMDNNHIRETRESYDPDQQVLRSQQTKNEKNVNTQPAPNTSVSNNLPNANVGQQQNGSQSNLQEQTNNYEIGKTIRTLVQDQPRISRISVAVVVDGIRQNDAKGHLIWEPRSQEELNRLTALTKSAMGFDQSRGDIVTVVSMRFADVLSALPSKNYGWNKTLTKFSKMEALRLLLFVLCLLLIIFFVMRPLLKPIAMTSNVGSHHEGSLPLVGTSSSIQISGLANHRRDQDVVVESERFDNGNQLTTYLGGMHGKIKASSVQNIMSLIETHPSETISVLRGWIAPQEENTAR